jgi:hypothetical protein
MIRTLSALLLLYQFGPTHPDNFSNFISPADAASYGENFENGGLTEMRRRSSAGKEVRVPTLRRKKRGGRDGAPDIMYAGQAAGRTFSASGDFAHSPATCRVARLKRFQVLISAMEVIRAARARSS